MLDIKIFYYFVRVWNELRDLIFNALSLHCRSCIFISNWFSYFGDYLYIERSKSKSDLKISKKWYKLQKKYLTISQWSTIFYRKMYGYHIRMNTIKDDRNKEDKNDLMQVEKCYVCWFYCASKIIAVVSKESTFIFFCQNKNWYKTFKSILYQYHVSFMSFILADSHQFGVIIFGSLSTNTNQYKSFRQ